MLFYANPILIAAAVLPAIFLRGVKDEKEQEDAAA